MDEEITLVKKAEYLNDLLESIRLVSPRIKKEMDNRDDKKIKELLVEYYVTNFNTLNKWVVLNGIGENYTQEELEAIKNNLFQLVK